MSAVSATIGELVEACEIEEEWLKTGFEPEHAQDFANHEDLKGDSECLCWKEWALDLDLNLDMEKFGAVENGMIGFPVNN